VPLFDDADIARLKAEKEEMAAKTAREAEETRQREQERQDGFARAVEASREFPALAQQLELAPRRWSDASGTPHGEWTIWTSTEGDRDTTYVLSTEPTEEQLVNLANGLVRHNFVSDGALRMVFGRALKGDPLRS